MKGSSKLREALLLTVSAVSLLVKVNTLGHSANACCVAGPRSTGIDVLTSQHIIGVGAGLHVTAAAAAGCVVGSRVGQVCAL